MVGKIRLLLGRFKIDWLRADPFRVHQRCKSGYRMSNDESIKTNIKANSGISRLRMLDRVWSRAKRKLGEWKERLAINLGCYDLTDVQLEEYTIAINSPLNTRNSHQVRFVFDTKDKNTLVEIIDKEYTDEKSLVIAHADRIVRQDLTWLIPNTREFGGTINWHSNLRDEQEWPLLYYKQIDYLGPKRIGDIRTTWELNRLQYFVTLGKAYWYTNDEKYAEAFVQQLIDWIDKNPLGRGINWISSLEVAVRLTSLICSYYFFKNSPSFGKDQQRQFIRTVVQQSRFLNKHLSLSRNLRHNHILGEAAGLAIVGIFLSNLKEAEGWKQKGLEIFWNEIISQFRSDGVSGEIATSYHLFVVDFAILVLVLCKRNAIHIPVQALQNIEKAITFTMYLTTPEGNVPFFGDTDGGRAARLEEGFIIKGNDYRSFLSTGSVLFERGDLKWLAGRFHEESLWLLGHDGLQAFKKLKGQPPLRTSKMFADTGFFIMRSEPWHHESSYCAFSFGSAIRDNVGTSHRHADIGHFVISFNGLPYLVDPGNYTYSGGDKWRFYFRSTYAHNTVSVDGKDQSDVTSKRFAVEKRATPSLHSWYSSDSLDFIDVSHDGYANSGITCRRRLAFIKPNLWILLDDIVGEDLHLCEQHFLCHPDLHVTIDKKEARFVGHFLNQSDENIHILSLRNGDLTLSRERGKKTNDVKGWFSQRYGQKVEADHLSFGINERLPIQFRTALYIGSSAPNTNVMREIADAIESSEVCYTKLESRIRKISKGEN